MTGTVDNQGRALLPIRLRHPTTGVEAQVDAWIDTGFTGELVLPQPHVASLGLPLGTPVQAGLADGSVIALQAYVCLVEWFGVWKQVEAVANVGQFPLLGVGLLHGHELHIDYRAGTLTLT